MDRQIISQDDNPGLLMYLTKFTACLVQTQRLVSGIHYPCILQKGGSKFTLPTESVYIISFTAISDH